MKFIFSVILFFSCVLVQAQQYVEVSVNGSYPLTAHIDFETASDSAFIAADTSAGNLWQIGHPQKTIFSSALMQNRSIVTDTINTYPINNRSSFTIGCINYYSCWGTAISFAYAMHSSAGYDGGMLEVSYDNGLNWQNFADLNYIQVSSVSGFYGTADTVRSLQAPGFTGITGTAYASAFFRHHQQTVHDTLLLRFTFASDSIAEPGDGWMIDNIVFSAGCDVSVPENQTEAFRIFPNPADQVIHLGGVNCQRIELYDAAGRMVLAEKTCSELHVSAIDPGMYYLRLLAEGNSSVQKVLIHHPD